MFLNHEEELVEIKTKGGITRKFKLIEHTCEELDAYIELTASKYDEAIEQMRIAQRSLNFGQTVDAKTLFEVKEQIAEHSADIVASLLKDFDGSGSVTASWIRKNTTRKMREKIMNKQNEIDGIETVQDQSFLIERGALIAAIQVRQASLQKTTQEHVPIDELEAELDG